MSRDNEAHRGPRPELLLFDLGGVLIDNAGPEWLQTYAGASDDHATIVDAWLRSPTVRAFESGQCSPVVFADEVIREFGLTLERDAFLDALAAWLRGFFPGTVEMLDTLSDRFRLACLTNTNVLHLEQMRTQVDLDRHFDHVFASCETGRLKPDSDAFVNVCRKTGVAPERIVFVDDSERNVVAATAVGMRAYRATGIEQVRDVLDRIGVC